MRFLVQAKCGYGLTPLHPTESLMLIGEGGLQRMHALTQVTVRGGDDQVEVVCHDGIGMDLPGEAHRGGQDDLQEDLFCLVGFEDGCPRLRPIVGMVGALVGELSSSSGHCWTVTT